MNRAASSSPARLAHRTSSTTYAMTLSNFLSVVALAAVCSSAATSRLVAQSDDPANYPLTTELAAASDEAEQALSTFKVPDGWKAELWAAEPMVGNPVVFTIDNQGRVIVCESYRQVTCVTDNRDHDEVWTDHDLASQTVEDRIAYHKKLLPLNGIEYTKHDDLLRVLTDSDGDGKADQQHVWADHFNELEMGAGAGVLVNGDDVYYTCIPHLWRLRDNDGDGKSDFRESLSSGYGVRVAFRGHDSHGLVIGPDRRLYFSIGDRGYHIDTREGKKLHDPSSGAVFRCELDGSNLEVVATGLRNPQELAFDELGNLFTGDNNSDGGDKARWVYVAEGGDSGWRMYYQYMNDRGPFSREKIWHPYHHEQPAFIVPPIANFSDGPSGLAYYPGTGLSNEYHNRFFLCDFRGASAVSGIRTFRSKQSGAFYELVDDTQPIWQILATDLHFGPDGWIYISDWVNGWSGEEKGRIYRFGDPDNIESRIVKDVQAMLNSGLNGASPERLVALMNHQDQRIRQMAQFKMVDKQHDEHLVALATSQSPLLGRLHALWAIGQRIRADRNTDLQNIVANLLSNEQPELRAQAAKLVGDLRLEQLSNSLINSLSDPEPRVRYSAGVSIGKLDMPEAVGPLVELLDENDGKDPAIRHAAIIGLAGQRSAEVDYVAIAEDSASIEVRRALVVVLRKQQSSRVKQFLSFAKDRLVLEEVARAIYDVPRPTMLEELAQQLNSNIDSEPFLLRCMGACNHLGGDNRATGLARFAANPANSNKMRIEAIKILSEWPAPSSRDYVIGMWRPIETRDASPAANALTAQFSKLIDTPALQAEAIKAASQLKLTGVSNILETLFKNTQTSEVNRKSALLALASMDSPNLAELTNEAFSHPSPLLRMAAREVNVDKNLDATKDESFWNSGLSSKDLRERQHTYKLLQHEHSQENGTVQSVVGEQIARLLAGQVPTTDRLDVVSAAASWSDDETITSQLDKYHGTFDQALPVSKYQDTLFGGDAERGKDIFLNRTSVSCQRCHQVGAAGGLVGPDLSNIGSKKDRKYLLESLVDVDKSIAENFETTVILDIDGNTLSGIVQKETDELLIIIDADAKITTIKKENIEGRRKGKSAMPADLAKHLSPAEIRDLIEYLATRKIAPMTKPATSVEGH